MDKRYVIILSSRFMKGHRREGANTNFKKKFLFGQGVIDYNTRPKLKKIHTIRKNYNLWQRRFKEIQKGKAVLSIRQWSGLPYRSKQEEIARLTAEDGIGIQKLTIIGSHDIGSISDGNFCINDQSKPISVKELASNDGLSLYDFQEWMCGIESKELVIIHFTPFRY